MSNMSYCRFTNTSRDLDDCLDALADGKELSQYEAREGKAMFKGFLKFCKDNWIIDDFDAEAIDNLFDAATEREGEDDD